VYIYIYIYIYDFTNIWSINSTVCSCLLHIYRYLILPNCVSSRRWYSYMYSYRTFICEQIMLQIKHRLSNVGLDCPATCSCTCGCAWVCWCLLWFFVWLLHTHDGHLHFGGTPDVASIPAVPTKQRYSNDIIGTVRRGTNCRESS